MPCYLVRMDHPDGDAWDRHVFEHLQSLKTLIDAGSLLASGPLAGLGHRAGFLLFDADSRASVERMVDGDPFAREGLIVALRIEEWDPLFGAFADRSSGNVPPPVKALFAGR